MKTLLLASAIATSLGATSLSPGPSLGADKIPATKLEVHQSLADSLEEFQGRALLIEFFAHW